MLPEVIQLLALLLLLAGPVFLLFVWRGVREPAPDSCTGLLQHSLFVTVFPGMVLFALAGLLEVISAPGVAGSGMAGMGSPARLLDTISGAVLVKVMLAMLFAGCFYLAFRRHAKGLYALSMIPGLALLAAVNAGSHAAAQPGLLPVISNLLHLMAAVIWGGGVMFLTLISRDRKRGGTAAAMGPGFLSRLIQRYTSLALLMFGVVALTGAVQAFINIHSPSALDSTAYGQWLKIKLVLAALLFAALSVNLVKLNPVLGQRLKVGGEQEAGPVLRRLGVLTGIEALLIIALFVTSSVMAVQTPPDSAPFLSPRSWTLTAGEIPMQVNLQPVGGSREDVRFQIGAVPSAPAAIPDGTDVRFGLSLPGYEAGVRDAAAVNVGSGNYLGEASFPFPGEWRFQVTLNLPDGSRVTGESGVAIPPQPLQQDLRAYLSLAAAGFTGTSRITFSTGLLLFLTTGWLVWQGRRGKVPLWVMPASLAGIGLGAYLMLSVTLVKTYPSTYRDNPLPYTASVINQGEDLYQRECAECHGSSGEGDGPWALAEHGSIPSLTTPHMDVHTDGEVFWWISRGIPSLDMPALQEQLSARERWAVINYVRSLRYGVPGQD